MISSTLTALSNDLRRAAARRAYADVERLVVRVGEAAAGEARALPAGDPGVREIAVWLKELFDRTEILLRIGRASHADEFRRITFLKRYLPRQDGLAQRVRLAV